MTGHFFCCRVYIVWPEIFLIISFEITTVFYTVRLVFLLTLFFYILIGPFFLPGCQNGIPLSRLLLTSLQYVEIMHSGGSKTIAVMVNSIITLDVCYKIVTCIRRMLHMN